ncbi:MAG: hypothetical protein NC395_07310 [Prevotella sp.]|nr:hypothetical protein [Prevotella sp.]
MKSFTVRCAIVWWDWATYDNFSFSVRSSSIRSESVSSKKKKKKATTPFIKNAAVLRRERRYPFKYDYKLFERKNQYGGRPLTD